MELNGADSEERDRNTEPVSGERKTAKLSRGGGQGGHAGVAREARKGRGSAGPEPGSCRLTAARPAREGRQESAAARRQ